MSHLPASHMLPDLTGAFVDEGYLQLVQLLGYGGFAKVYKALDTTSPEDTPIYYAVKCMRSDVPGSRYVHIYPDSNPTFQFLQANSEAGARDPHALGGAERARRRPLPPPLQIRRRQG